MPSSYRVIKGESPGESHVVALRHLLDGLGGGLTGDTPDPLQQARSEAALVLDRARIDAAALLAAAAGEARELLENARQETDAWREKAWAEGHAAGLAGAVGESRETLARAAQVLAEAEEERRVLLAGLEEELAELALTVARQVVARELGQAPAAVMAIAREALELVRNRERVTVYVNPAEADLFRARRGDLEGSLSDRALLVIIADQEVPAGGVRVETEQGLVDATLEARFAAFQGVLRNRGSER